MPVDLLRLAGIHLPRVHYAQFNQNVVGYVPHLIGALQSLALDAITRPASNMLNCILSALPAIFAAALIVGIAYAIGRVVCELVTNLLTVFGFTAVLAKLGLGREPSAGERSPAQIAGYLVFFGILLFAAIEAVRELCFDLLGARVSIIVLGGAMALRQMRLAGNCRARVG